jgi:Transposase IS4
VFPYDSLGEIADLTNIHLLQKNCAHISVGTLLKFFGVLVLTTRFGKRHDMWKPSPPSNHIPEPAFGKTGMSRNSFGEISACIRFSDQPKTQGELSAVRYGWKPVNEFVSAVNTHRRTMFTPSEHICLDEYIARWYGQGAHWIDTGLPHYVAIDPKPETG